MFLIDINVSILNTFSMVSYDRKTEVL